MSQQLPSSNLHSILMPCLSTQSLYGGGAEELRVKITTHPSHGPHTDS